MPALYTQMPWSIELGPLTGHAVEDYNAWLHEASAYTRELPEDQAGRFAREQIKTLCETLPYLLRGQSHQNAFGNPFTAYNWVVKARWTRAKKLQLTIAREDVDAERETKW